MLKKSAILQTNGGFENEKKKFTQMEANQTNDIVDGYSNSDLCRACVFVVLCAVKSRDSSGGG